jgi:hypothetical protein
MLRKLPFETSEPILERFDLSEEGALIVAPEMPPETAIEVLFKADLMVDMLKYFAHGMPPREGACWAVATMRDRLGDLDAKDQELLTLAEKWVKDPQEVLRMQLMDEGETRDNEDPFRWLCCAIAWNGSGSIGPKGGPSVFPATGLYASAFLGAVSLLVGTSEEGHAEVHKSAYRNGLEVARGGWPMQSD